MRLARRPLVVPLALAAVALAARLLPGVRAIDDSYITFRYARNLLAGQGFVYNPGEHVLGTTTPVYTLLMAGLAALFRTQDFPQLATAVNALADAGTCALLVRLGERLAGRRRVGVAAGLLWAVAPMSVTFAVGGMETSVFILLMLAVFALHLRPPQAAPGRRVDAPADVALPGLCALALLTRPDAALFVGPLGLDLIVRRLYEVVRKKKEGAEYRLGAAAAAFLLPLGAWALFAEWYFGNSLPHSIAAKAAAYLLPPYADLIRLIQHYGTPFFEQNLFGRFWPLVGLALYLLLHIVAALDAVRRDGRAWAIVIYPWVYLLAFSIANPLLFRWYLAPPLPVYFLCILGGLAKIADDVAVWRRRQHATRDTRAAGLNASAQASVAQSPTPQSGAQAVSHLLFLAPTTLFLALSLNAWTLHPDHGPDRPAPEMAWHRLELIYERIGRELAGQIDPQTTIAAGDVGALGYFSGARILDTVGLISPEATAYYPLPESAYVINYAIAPDLILAQSPDYVVFLEVYGRNTLLQDARFKMAYELVETIPTDIYGSRGMMIWRRK